MSAPIIVDLHMKKGRRPRYTKYIGRRVRFTEFHEDSKWYNPFPLKKWGRRALVMFEPYMRRLLSKEDPLNDRKLSACLLKLSNSEWYAVGEAVLQAERRWGKGSWDLKELSDQIIGCWCVDDGECTVTFKCHGQILIKLWYEEFRGGRFGEKQVAVI